ncbi:hypothetical protein GVAV_001832 [Gurleya vavrai]
MLHIKNSNDLKTKKSIFSTDREIEIYTRTLCVTDDSTHKEFFDTIVEYGNYKKLIKLIEKNIELFFKRNDITKKLKFKHKKYNICVIKNSTTIIFYDIKVQFVIFIVEKKTNLDDKQLAEIENYRRLLFLKEHAIKSIA